MSQRIGFTGKLAELMTAASMMANSLKEIVQNTSLSVVGASFRSDILNYMTQYAFLLREIRDNLVSAGLISPSLAIPPPEQYETMQKSIDMYNKFIKETYKAGIGLIAQGITEEKKLANEALLRSITATTPQDISRAKLDYFMHQARLEKLETKYNEWLERVRGFLPEDVYKTMMGKAKGFGQYYDIMEALHSQVGMRRAEMGRIFGSPIKMGMKAVLGEIAEPFKQAGFMLRHPKVAIYKALYGMARGIASFRESAKYWAGLNIKMVALYILLAPLTQTLSGLLKVFQPLMVVFQAFGTILGLTIMPIILDITQFVIDLIGHLTEWVPKIQEFFYGVFRFFFSFFYGIWEMVKGGSFFAGFVRAIADGLNIAFRFFVTEQGDMLVAAIGGIISKILTSDEFIDAMITAESKVREEVTERYAVSIIKILMTYARIQGGLPGGSVSVFELFNPDRVNEP